MGEILTYKTVREKQEMAIKEVMGNEDLMENVLAISILPDVRDYIFIEIKDKDLFTNTCIRQRYVKGIVRGNIKVTEVTKHIDVLKDFKEGDVITVLAGPLKGNKGKVFRVDKKEVVVYLDETAIPIPIKLQREVLRKEFDEHSADISRYDGKSAKKMGVMKTFKCFKCDKEIEYLYIPAHKSMESAKGGGAIFMCQVDAKVVGPNQCPHCDKKTLHMFRIVEEGCKILK